MQGKKRNKKNKSKQAKETSDVASGAGKTPVQVQKPIHEPACEQNHQSQHLEDLGPQECGALELNVELDTQKVGEVQVDVDETLKTMKNEINSCIQKETDVDEKLNTMQNEINSCIQKEASLEERVQHLLNECDSFSQENASRDAKFEELKSEINSWILEETSLKERVKILEADKDFYILKEKSTKHVIDQLSDTNIILQKQVMELEESRDILLQESQRLTKCFTALETQILQLEKNTIVVSSSTEMVKHLSEEKNLLDRIETVREMAEEVILENAEIVKKVNEPYNVLNHRNVATDYTLESKIYSETDPNENTITTGHLLESYSDQPATLQNSLGSVPISDAATNGAFLLHEMPVPAEENTNLEILQLPLDEIQIEESTPGTMEVDEEPAVPLTDAPLIGAPFRLISFVAKYVSGADLVDGKSPTLR